MSYDRMAMREQRIYKDMELTLRPGYKTENFTLIPWKLNQSEKISLPITASTDFPDSFFKGNLQKQVLFDK